MKRLVNIERKFEKIYKTDARLLQECLREVDSFKHCEIAIEKIRIKAYNDENGTSYKFDAKKFEKDWPKIRIQRAEAELNKHKHPERCKPSVFAFRADESTAQRVERLNKILLKSDKMPLPEYAVGRQGLAATR